MPCVVPRDSRPRRAASAFHRDYGSVRAFTALERRRRAVRRGEVVLTSRPFCHLLESSVVGQYCDTCLKRDKPLVRCGCGRAWYCGPLCRELAEPLHRRECRVFKQDPDYRPKDLARFLAKIIIKLGKEGGDDVSEIVDAKRTRKFKDLMSHSREIEHDERRLGELKGVMQDLRRLLSPLALPEHKDLVAIYGKVVINSFCLLDQHLQPIGTALYLAASVLDHACSPNAFVSFVGTRLVVRSLVDWQDLDLDMVRISYVDALDTREGRLQQLRDNYYFSCDCRVCRDDDLAKAASSVPCRGKGCTAPVHVDESGCGWVEPCRACGFCRFPRGLAQRYVEAAQYTRDELRDLNPAAPSLEVWEDVVEFQGDLFHPLNVWRSRSLEALTTANVAMRRWAAALGPARANEAAMRHYYGTKHPYVGLYLMQLAQVEMNNMEYQAALEHLLEAEDILEAGVGSGHPLVFADLAGLLVQASEECRMELQRSIIYGHQYRPINTSTLAKTKP